MENETLMLLLNVVCGPVIFAVIELLKKKLLDLNPALTTAIAVVLAILSTWGLSIWLAPGLPFGEVVKTALAVVGLSGAVNSISKYRAESKTATP